MRGQIQDWRVGKSTEWLIGPTAVQKWNWIIQQVEPEPPQPFTFSDQLSEDQRPYRSLFRYLSITSQAHGGSVDSGMYELNNRRLLALNDVLEFSLRLSVKRLREDP